MDRLVDKLREAHKREQANIVTNPLRQIVDLLSLTPIELEAWMQVFEKVDTGKEGAVTFDQIFEFFEETPTLFAREIFTGMDAVDEYGTVEFGDFVRSVGTWIAIDFFGSMPPLFPPSSSGGWPLFDVTVMSLCPLISPVSPLPLLVASLTTLPPPLPLSLVYPPGLL